MIPGMNELPYAERLRKLSLWSLEAKSLSCRPYIEAYKILTLSLNWTVLVEHEDIA